jgi:hypothetical protein
MAEKKWHDLNIRANWFECISDVAFLAEALLFWRSE